MRKNKTMMQISCQHPPLGIIVLVLLCYSFSMSAAPVSSSAWTMGGSTFRSTSTSAYRSNTSSRIGYTTGQYSSTNIYPRTSGSYSMPRANSIGNHSVGSSYRPSNSIGNHSAGSSYRPYSSSSATRHSYGSYSNAYGSSYSHTNTNRSNSYSYGGISTGSSAIGSSAIGWGADGSSAVVVGNRYADGSSAAALTSATFTKRDVYIPGVSEEDGYGKYYDEELDDWLPIPDNLVIGQTYQDSNGNWYVWNGSAWVLSPKEVEPVGDIPWILVLALAFLTCIHTHIRTRQHEA